MTLAELIERLGGELLQGDPGVEIRHVADVSKAGLDDLVFAENEAALAQAVASHAAAVVAPTGVRVPRDSSVAAVAVSQPRLWFSQAARLISVELPVIGIHSSAEIDPDAQISEGVTVGPCVVIGRGCRIGRFSRIEAGAIVCETVRIGEHSRIHPRVVLYPGTTVGDRVIVHAGAVLGADGFGYVRDRETGAYTQFPQQGTLVVEDDVEIGANATIDRGALQETRIRRGVKIDNLVHVGHNCDIGEDVVMASLTGISGSSTIGRGAILAGQVGIGDHAHIGPGVILGGQAGVLSGKTITTQGTVLWGTPAKPLKEYLRELATLARLARRKKE